MKEESESEMMDAEQLLRSKSWSQLNSDELKEAAALFSGEAEYERMRNMVHRLRAGAGVADDEVQPSEYVRENLLAAFEDEQRRRRVLWWNSLGFWFRDQLRFDIPAVRIAVAGIILFIGVFTVMRLSRHDNTAQPVVAKKDNAAPVNGGNQSPGGDVPVQNSNTDNITQGKSPGQESVPVAPDAQQDETPVIRHMNPAPQPEVVYISPELQQSLQQISNSPIENAVTNLANDSNTIVVANGNTNDSALVIPTITNATSVICSGAGTTLTATPTATFTYSWNNNPTFTNATVLQPSGSIYTVTTNAGPTKTRSLANDQEVLNVFFAMK